MSWLVFIAGLFIGAVIGFFLASLFAAQADDIYDNEDGWDIK